MTFIFQLFFSPWRSNGSRRSTISLGSRETCRSPKIKALTRGTFVSHRSCHWSTGNTFDDWGRKKFYASSQTTYQRTCKPHNDHVLFGSYLPSKDSVGSHRSRAAVRANVRYLPPLLRTRSAQERVTTLGPPNPSPWKQVWFVLQANATRGPHHVVKKWINPLEVLVT